MVFSLSFLRSSENFQFEETVEEITTVSSGVYSFKVNSIRPSNLIESEAETKIGASKQS